MTAERPVDGGPRLLGSASILAVGNVASRLLGLARATIIGYLFGGGREVSAFFTAAAVPTMIFDLLTGGMLSSALVPVLSDYATRRRAEMWRAASVFLSAAAVVTGAAAVLVYAFAPRIAAWWVPEYGPEGVAMVARNLQLISPAIVAFGVAGVLMAVLYALERFSWPAMQGAIYNAVVILVMLSQHGRLGVYALPLGVAAGSIVQLATLGIGLRDGRLRPTRHLRHPAVRRALLLYAPIGAGLLVTQVQVLYNARYASRLGDSVFAWMGFATSLNQFPHGFIAVAISLAILPRLSAVHARSEPEVFASTLARGLRAVLALALPAALGLAVLAEPVAGLVFQRGAFVDGDRLQVARALHGYLVGLPFAAVDLPLIYAFYARQQTIVPAAVGVVSIGVYFVAAVALMPVAGMLGLVLADSAKHVTHALVMLWLIRRAAGPAALAGTLGTAVRAGAAGLVMAAAVTVVDGWLVTAVGEGTAAWAVRVAVGSGLGVSVYGLLAARWGVGEIGWLVRVLRDRLGV